MTEGRTSTLSRKQSAAERMRRALTVHGITEKIRRAHRESGYYTFWQIYECLLRKYPLGFPNINIVSVTGSIPVQDSQNNRIKGTNVAPPRARREEAICAHQIWHKTR